MTTTVDSTATTDEMGLRWIRRLATINLGFVALQALSAGFLLSGYARALALHQIGSVALQFGALVQSVAAIVHWRRRRVPPWVAVLSIGLFVIVFLQTAFGYRGWYWLHVPIGVGLFGGLTRQLDRLTTLSRTTWRLEARQVPEG